MPFGSDLVEQEKTPWEKAKPMGKIPVDGKACEGFEFRYDSPLALAPAHDIQSSRRYVDAERNVIVKQEDLDAAGKVVGTTTFSDFTADDEGNLFPLSSKSILEPGRATISIPQPAKTAGASSELAQTSVPVSERTIDRKYQMIDKSYVVLSDLQVTDGNKALVLKAKFDQFVINQGVDDVLFDLSR